MLEHYFAAQIDTARVREAARKAHRRAVQEHAVASLRARRQSPVQEAAARPSVEQARPEPTKPAVIAAQVADA